MSRLLLQILQRLTALAVLLTLGLIAIPPLLREFEVIGPGVAGEIASAENALEAARTYGATGDMGPFQEAEKELELARTLLAQHHRHRARRAAERARDLALEAQRLSLLRGEEDRRRAEQVTQEVDRIMNGLEDLYAEVTPTLDKADVNSLLSQMKGARKAAAALSLAYEQGDYRRVTQSESQAKATLGGVRKALEAKQKPT